MNLDKRLVRRAFAGAAQQYDDAAVLQREIADRLIERLSYINFIPGHILEIGSGTGYCTQLLQKHYSKAHITALDIAYPMLVRARAKPSWWSNLRRKVNYLCADAESLPLADNSVDMVFSNLTLQWVTNLESTLREIARILRPGGMLLFSSFGPGTLTELREAWQAVDSYTHINAFIDLHDIGDAMVRAEFAEPVMDAERLTLTYSDVYGLMRDLKTIGAHNVTLQRRRGLTGKAQFKKLESAYETFRHQGLLPASYEVVYGHAWSPLAANEMTINIPLEQISKQGPDKT